MITSGHNSSLEGARTFDDLIDEALTERQALYGGAPVFDDHHLRRMRVLNMALALLEGGVYPDNRLPSLVGKSMDVKLQLYIAGEVVPGLMNQSYFNRITTAPQDAAKVSVQLIRLSLRQDLIVKIRILWERIMGLIHLIQTGERNLPRGRGRSAKAVFFDMCREHDRWKWVTAYEDKVAEFDSMFRTPEVHGFSTLRARLMNNDEPPDLDNKILSMLSAAMNEIWVNIESILRDQGVTQLGAAHMPPANQDIPNDWNPFEIWGWRPEDG